MEQETELYCRACSSICRSGDAYCFNCGYPFLETEKVRNAFILQYRRKIREREDIAKYIKQSRIILMVLSAVAFLVSMYFFAKLFPEDRSQFITGAALLLISIVYTLLAWWSDKRPFAAALTGLLLYLTLFVFDAIGSGASFFATGLILKLVIILLLSRGVYSARKFERFKKEEKYG